jgi:hypothetical protein
MSESNLTDPEGPLVPDNQETEGPSFVSSNGDEEGIPAPDYGDGMPPEMLWIKEGENRIVTTIYTYKDPKTGRLKNVSLDFQTALRELGFVEYPIEVEWSIPTREQLDAYRERASRIDIRTGRPMTHRATVQGLIIRNHLLELRFPSLSTSSGAPQILPLPRDSHGGLTKAALKTLGQLHSSVLDLLYVKYVDESALLI